VNSVRPEPVEGRGNHRKETFFEDEDWRMASHSP